MKDQKSLLKVVSAVPISVGKVSVEGSVIDRKGYESITFAAVVGAGEYSPEANVGLDLLDSDDGIAYEAVPSNKFLGSMDAVTESLDADTVRTVGYIGDRRHVRLDFVVTGILATDVSLAALAILGYPFQAPTP